MDEMIDILKEDLANNYHDDEEVIEHLYENYLSIASHYSNRKKDDELLKPYVYNAIKEAYLLRGDEGKKSSSEGGLNSSYVDIEEKLRNDVISIRLGNF